MRTIDTDGVRGGFPSGPGSSPGKGICSISFDNYTGTHMCFSISLVKEREYLEERFGPLESRMEHYDPIYHSSAFSFPSHPVITLQDNVVLRSLRWGLIPHWVKDGEKAQDIRSKTLNARAETLLEKPSFASSFGQRRCLIPVDGFFEWREVGSRKYPYHIRMKDGETFAIAGIWDRWGGPSVDMDTFSLITTSANPLLAMIHNTKLRMPAIIDREDERRWLDPDTSADELMEILKPIDDAGMEAYTVSRLVSSRENDSDVPEVLKPHKYPELSFTNQKLF